MSHDRNRVWMITGASQGLGRAFTEAALEAGDVVVATSRRPAALDDLTARHGDRVLPLAMDVTDRGAVLKAFAEVAERTGGIDVLVNNAGYGLAGGVEEVGEQLVRDQMDVNFYGMLWVLQGVLPIMRRQGGGRIFQISSIAGITTYPNLGMYCASKWAMEAVGETLAKEVAGTGIKVVLCQLGEFRTAWSAGSMVRAEPMPEYDGVLAGMRKGLSGALAERQPGDPELAARVLLEMADHDDPPLRLLLGGAAGERAPQVYRERLAEWEAWSELTPTVDREPAGADGR